MTDTARPLAEIEYRSVADLGVSWQDRTIELIAVPYDQDATVVVHGRTVTESHAPGAYDGVEQRANRVKVNRDHDYQRTIGRAVALHPSRSEGLVAELRIARTPLGDETLALADDKSLEASVGFAVMEGGERWTDHRARRRIVRAYLDHIAMVPEGAYNGEVLAVRSAPLEPAAPTPNLDQVRAWLTAATGAR